MGLGQSKKTVSPVQFIYDELADIECIFKMLATEKDIKIFNLACGSFHGATKFKQYYPHNNSKLIGLDVRMEDQIRRLTKFDYFEFHYYNLLCEPPDEVVSWLQSSTIWISRHPCITTESTLKLFEQYAVPYSKLIIVPCYCSGYQKVQDILYQQRRGVQQYTSVQKIKNSNRNLLLYVYVKTGPIIS